jgi:hypothetical protein
MEFKFRDLLMFKGNWTSLNSISFFDRKEGEAKFFISRFYSEFDLHREKIVIKYFMFDGKYEDKTLGVFSYNFVSRNDSNNDTFTMLPKNYDTTIEYIENFERVLALDG